MANEEQINTNEAQVQQAVDAALKDQKKKKKKKRLIILLVLVVIIVAVIVITSMPKDYDYDNPTAQVTVDEILNDYDEDSASAAEKYSDQVIAVTGKVGDIMDEYAIIYPYDDDNWLYSVNAYMSSTDDLKEFTVGETITVVGVCDDTTLFGDVDVKDCVLNDSFAVVPDYDNAQSVDVDDLVEAYKANQVSADETYKDSVIEISAVVTYVSDDYIVMEPDDADAFDWDCDIEVCFEDDADIASFKEDEKATIVGVCQGDSDFYTVKIARAIVK